MINPPPYDYIIAGAGCAGLSLAVHMIRSEGFADKKILIVDQDVKRANDRTWCFWEEQPGPFEHLVFSRWQKLWFHGESFSRKLDIAPHTYKMIRGIDFYSDCLRQIEAQPNFSFLQGKVEHVVSSDVVTGVMVQGQLLHSHYVFNSILFERPELSPKEYWLLQHFKGRIIETTEDVFDPATATLMDFRTDQKNGTAFCYVLPLSARQALVEYTLFSEELLSPEAYEQGLDAYIGDILKLKEYKIIDEEFGVIPMTNVRFEPYQNNIINIGTAGGQTKGSTGYTFRFIQKHSAALVRQLLHKGDPFLPRTGGRFAFYDSVLLNILHHKTLPGRNIFTDLFKKNKPGPVLRFLDNESSLLDELKIISSLPTWPFMKAAMKQV
jgi:lycopene beta-cyclase